MKVSVLMEWINAAATATEEPSTDYAECVVAVRFGIVYFQTYTWNKSSFSDEEYERAFQRLKQNIFEFIRYKHWIGKKEAVIANQLTGKERKKYLLTHKRSLDARERWSKHFSKQTDKYRKLYGVFGQLKIFKTVYT